MEEHLSPLAVTHLLQHTLRSLCIHDNSQWVYAVFWRILPRNYPPPKWDGQGAYDRSRGNRRNWILVWEDGFCNFAASSAAEMNSISGDCEAGSSIYGGSSDQFPHFQGLQPELFFKMSHEIYNYGEGLIGKVAADHSHKWIHKEPNEQEINFLSAWHNSADSHPRTWEAQFQSGIKTIALIAVREGVVQLGAVHKVIEDLSYIVMLRKKFSYIESIPGVLLPHPSSAAYPGYGGAVVAPETWQFQGTTSINAPYQHHPSEVLYDHHHFMNNNNPQFPFKITPSMSSLEALLSKLPSVVPPPQQTGGSGSYCDPPPPHQQQHSLHFLASVAKEENVDEECHRTEEGEASSSISAHNRRRRRHQHQQHNYLQHHEDQNLQPAMGFDQ